MEDSAFQAIYTGVYIVIFLAALTTTLYLFNGINDLADKSYEYGRQSTGSGLIEVQDTSTLTLSKSDLVSYYMNYIKKDKYEDASSADFGTVSFSSIVSGANTNSLTYSEFVKKIENTNYEFEIKTLNSVNVIKKK